MNPTIWSRVRGARKGFYLDRLLDGGGGLVVQRYECLACIQEVGGSNPPQSTYICIHFWRKTILFKGFSAFPELLDARDISCAAGASPLSIKDGTHVLDGALLYPSLLV